MALITIDPEKCRRDGLCVRVCQKVFSQETDDSVPLVVNEDSCNGCGHCVLVCPFGAITQANCPPGNIHHSTHDLMPTYDQVHELLVTRRSTRTFLDKPVERELIEKTIDGARFAPSAKNTQSTEFLVVQGRVLLHALASATAEWLGRMSGRLKNPVWRKLYLLRGEASTEQVTRWTGQFDLIAQRMREGTDLVLFNAPVLILFHADKAASFAEANANLAIQNATLVAASLKLGTFYTGYLVGACQRDKAMTKLLNLPATHVVYAGLALGHPKIRFSQWIDRNPPKITWM